MQSNGFITIKDYLGANAQPLLNNPGIGDQPASMPEFRFGKQPAGLKDVDVLEHGRRRRIGIIGAGDVYRKFVGWALDHRGTERFIYDKSNPVTPGALEHRVDSMDQMPKDIDYLLVLTPPCYHADYVRWAQQNNIPVMVEKPFVADTADLVSPGGISDQLRAATAPVYAMDWEVPQATPLMTALGMNVPFQDAVQFSNREAFKNFDLSHVTRIEATFLEGGDNPLGNVAKARQDRPWAFDIRKGGGALFDMGVHPLNTLAAMGFLPGEIHSATLGDPIDGGRKGVYRRIGNGENTAEFYAHVEMDSQRDGRRIPTLIETGKGGVANDMRIKLVDDKGHVIDWEYGPEKSEVTLRNARGDVLATAQSNTDPYGLMFEQATRFFEAEKSNAGPKIPLYYHEHHAVLDAVERMHQRGRAQAVPDGETVSQLILKRAAAIGVEGGMRGAGGTSGRAM